MNDVEIYSLLVQFNIAAMTATALFLTAASGYLAVAYLVGAKLTRMQNLTVSTLFVGFGLFFTYGTFGYFARATYFYSLLAVKPPGISMNEAIPFVVSGFELMGIFACLKFMHDVCINGGE